MTTPTIEQIHRHASVRKYKPDPIPREMVDTIVSAGQRASTSSNLQAYSAVAVTGMHLRRRLYELCANQAHILEAPVFIAWCADFSRLDRVAKKRGYQLEPSYLESFLVATVDVALLMQTATLAAESLGLGMCYIGGIRNHPEQVIALLGLPRLVFPISGMTLGWPAIEPRLRPRLPTSAVLHWEGYDYRGEDVELNQYDQDMIDTGIYKGRQVPVSEAHGEIEDYGWMEHCARRVSKPIRAGLSHAVKGQGFDLK
jgi:FMN reductase (NADPH)